MVSHKVQKGQSMDLSADEILSRARAVVAREAAAVAALAPQLDEGLVDVVELLLDCEGHCLVTGAGTSALCISAADGLHGGAGAIRASDVLYVISKGGRSAEVNAFVDIAKGRGAKIVAQTETVSSPLAEKSDAVFCVRSVGEVDPYGMIATGSSLVNGAAGDAVCVLLLELRGHAKEAFGATHPGGAVGHMLAAGPQMTEES